MRTTVLAMAVPAVAGWSNSIRASSGGIRGSCLQMEDVVISSTCDSSRHEKLTRFAFTMTQGSRGTAGPCNTPGESVSLEFNAPVTSAFHLLREGGEVENNKVTFVAEDHLELSVVLDTTGLADGQAILASGGSLRGPWTVPECNDASRSAAAVSFGRKLRGTTPSPAETVNATETPATADEDDGVGDDVTPVPSAAPEDVEQGDGTTVAPAADESTPSPTEADADVDTPDATPSPSEADADLDEGNTDGDEDDEDDCSVCSNLSSQDAEALATDSHGVKRIVCDPTCLVDGISNTHCNYFDLGQICRGCGECDDNYCQPCPGETPESTPSPTLGVDLDDRETPSPVTPAPSSAPVKDTPAPVTPAPTIAATPAPDVATPSPTEPQGDIPETPSPETPAPSFAPVEDTPSPETPSPTIATTVEPTISPTMTPEPSPAPATETTAPVTEAPETTPPTTDPVGSTLAPSPPGLELDEGDDDEEEDDDDDDDQYDCSVCSEVSEEDAEALANDDKGVKRIVCDPACVGEATDVLHCNYFGLGQVCRGCGECDDGWCQPCPDATPSPVVPTPSPTTLPDLGFDPSTPSPVVPETPAPSAKPVTPTPSPQAPETPAPVKPTPSPQTPETSSPVTPTSAPQTPDTPAPVKPTPSPHTPETSPPVTPTPAPQTPDTPAPVKPTPSPQTPETPAPVMPTPSPETPETPAPVKPTPSPQTPETPAPVTPTPSPQTPETSSPVTPTTAPQTPETSSPVTPTPAPQTPETPAPVKPTPSPQTPETPAPVTPTPSPETPETPAPVKPTPSPQTPETPAPVTPTPSPQTPETSSPVTPTPSPQTPETPAPVKPTPSPQTPETPAPVTPTPSPQTPETSSPVKPTPSPQTPETPAPVTPTPSPETPETPAPVKPTPSPETPETAPPTIAETPAPEVTTPSPTMGLEFDVPPNDDEDECSVCSNLTAEQEEVLASYDNGGKQVVCDPTCLDGVTDPLHCNYFNLGQICRGCGECSSCEPCPDATPSPVVPTPSPTTLPDLGFDPSTPSPVVPETPAPSAKPVTPTPSPQAPETPSPVKPTPSPQTPETAPPTIAETPAPEMTTPSPTMGFEFDVPDDNDDECSVCSNLTAEQEEVLASYDNGGKQVVCDPTCLDGVTDPLHCNYFNLGQICRGCGECSSCEPCPDATPSPVVPTPSPTTLPDLGFDPSTPSPVVPETPAPSAKPVTPTPSPQAPETPASVKPTPSPQTPETAPPTIAETPAPEMTTPSPTMGFEFDVPDDNDDECSVCSNLTVEQEEALASYDNGGKQVVCDPTCLDGVTDPLHCNYFGLGQICRACGDCSSCQPCPGTTPAPESTSSPTMTPDLGFDLRTPSPVAPETPAPAKHTPSPTTVLEFDVPDDEDECSVCSNLTAEQEEVLASYDNGGKQVVCDPTCLDGVTDPLHCNYFGLGQICRACGDCSSCQPCPGTTPAPESTSSPTMTPDLGFDLRTPSPVAPETPAPVKHTPSPTTVLEFDVPDDEDECSVCSNLTAEQEEVLASYDNGGKQVVCDPTCLDGVTDPLHCNYFGLGQICRACGDCSLCEPCPETTPATEPTSSPTMVPDLGFDPSTPSPVTPAPSAKPMKPTPSPETPETAPPTVAETPEPEVTTPSPTAMVLEPDVTPDDDDDDDCSVCSNLTEAQMESLAAYPAGGKQIICDPRCIDGSSDITHCNYFGLGQICRGCGDCDDCTPCP